MASIAIVWISGVFVVCTESPPHLLVWVLSFFLFGFRGTSESGTEKAFRLAFLYRSLRARTEQADTTDLMSDMDVDE